MTMPSGPDPDYYTPTDHSIVGAGLAALATRTEANIRAQKQSQVGGNVSFQQIIAQLFQGIRLDGGVSLIHSVLEAIANALTGTINTFTNILEALLGIGTVHIRLTEHTEAIARLDEIAAASPTTVAYVGDLQDMVTIPRSQLVCTGVAGSRGHDVFADLNPINTLAVRAMPFIRPGNGGHIYYAPIIVDRHGIPDMIRWIGGSDSSINSGQYYEVALCIYNPANGNIEKVWGSGNIKDTYANTAILSEIQIDMGLDEGEDPQEVHPGQLLFWAHQQYANGFGMDTRAVAAAPQGNIGRPSTLLLDAASYLAPNYSQGIPSSISLASLTRENRFIPWGAISVSSLPVPEDP